MKKLLVMGLAVFAVTAAAAPAAALANWQSSGVSITKNVPIELNGSATVTGSGGGFTCSEMFADITLEPGTKGTLTAFGANEASTKCSSSGLYAACKIQSVTSFPSPLPSVEDAGTNIVIKGFGVTYQFESGCGLSSEDVYFNVLKLWPDKTKAMSTVTLTGEVYGGLFSPGGTLKVTPAAKYGL